MFSRLNAFVHHDRGNVAIISALVMIVLIGAAALGVDIGKVYVDRRQAQSVTDLAAIAAATNLTDASGAVAATVAQNNFQQAAPAAIQYGVYTADPSVPTGQRFVASSAASANAVRVSLQTTTALLFGRVLTGANDFAIQTVATATTTAFATFAIGSTLLSINNGLLNQILGQMLGTSVSLSFMDYQSLLNANLDLFDFMNALAWSLNITGVSYNSLLSGNAQVGTIINAMIDGEKAQSASSSVIFALSELSSALSGATANIPLSSLLSPGPYGTMTIGQTPSSTATVSALSMISAIAALANGTNQVAASVDAGIPGIASATVRLAIGQPPVGTSWVAVGPIGTTVYTAQTRLLLIVQIQGSGVIPSVKLPIYVALATGKATLNSITCGYPTMDTTTVTLGVTPGVVDAWIGNVTTSDFYNFASAPQPGPAPLVSAVGLTVTGLAHVTISNLTPTPLTFSYSQIQAQAPQTVSTQNFTSSLTSQLLSSLSLNVSIAGLGIGLPSTLTQAVSAIIAPVTTPLDQLIANLLATAGVSVGEATVWVTGVRCDGAVLVN